ncbi:MAG: acetylxylan esterase [Bryobacteraceae bacterium]|nr:acetylxylan esterase [Bryobacteraceae bacterium]
MRPIAGLLLALSLAAQVPERDARNTDIPNTDTHFSPRAYPTRAAWEAKKAQLRRQILFAAGLYPLPDKDPLQSTVFGRLERDGYSIEKVYLETLPGFYLGGNLYRPLGQTGPFPAVAKAHGHWAYGRLEEQPLASAHTLAVNLARSGYVVFSYDMLGNNDTLQTPHVFGGPVEQLWSFSPFGLQLWNSIRVIDFLESLPAVDPNRIAVTGASGGGTQTFSVAAVDDRVRYAAPVNMVSAIMQGGCRCENAAGLRIDTFNVEFAAMMAPRPLLLVSSTQDWTRNTPSEEFPAVREIYALYDAAVQVETVQIDAPHNYNRESREAVYRFLAKHAQGRQDAASIAESEAPVERLQDLLVFHARPLPPNALDYAGLFDQWKRASQRQSSATSDPAAIRERLQLAIKAEWPGKVASSSQDRKIRLSRPGAGDSVPALWFPGNGAPVLVAHPEGAQAAANLPKVREWLAAKRPVLLIDAFQTGSAAAPRDRAHEHFLTFNLTDDANRVQDILTALSFLNAARKTRIELAGFDKAAVWALFAAAIAPVEVDLAADLAAFRGADDDFVRQFFIPGIQRAGGLAAALKLTEGRRSRP